MPFVLTEQTVSRPSRRTVASDRRFLRYERHRADQHERGDDGFTVRGSLVTVTTASINLSGEGFLRDHHHRW